MELQQLYRATNRIWIRLLVTMSIAQMIHTLDLHLQLVFARDCEDRYCAVKVSDNGMSSFRDTNLQDDKETTQQEGNGLQAFSDKHPTANSSCRAKSQVLNVETTFGEFFLNDIALDSLFLP